MLNQKLTTLGGYEIVNWFEQDGLRIAHVPGRMAIEMTPEFRAAHKEFAAALFRYFDEQIKHNPSGNHKVHNQPMETSLILYFIPGSQEEAVAEDVLDMMIKHRIIKQIEKAQTLQSFGLSHSAQFPNKQGLSSTSYVDGRFMLMHFVSDSADKAQTMAERARQMVQDISGLRVGKITMHEAGRMYRENEIMRACLGCEFEPGVNSREVVGKALVALKEGKVKGSMRAEI